jgi:eukaryotic-like serine/threonine-protein kinase
MTPERWGRVKELFSAAAELPAANRAAFLAREAGDDVDLIAEVSSLIDSHVTAGRFLEDVPPELRAAALDAGDSARAGERIGAYRLVEMIGTGGMGDVYKALRDDDQYRAEVAIKLMRAEVRNPLAEQRFKNERQILAALDHRNIARLLDGGATSNGLPYVVMELVNGKPIDVYCDERALGTRDRLQLFLQVCAAVSYAHQHLVVHRDLKPNNILVTADGSVKLLDFGIAKLLEAEAVTGTVTEETRTQLRAMTLDYASPEQVSGGTVTTVSDVYSLGVVLYRLLTGQSPYRAQGGDAARMAEILGDTSPTRPSQVETRTRASIDSDLDHVLLMALRKEPAKRYGSAEQFADDLRNYLQGRPVLARRGSLGYRLGKLARRNKVAIAAAALVVVSLITGLGLALREARIADEQRIVAQRHFDRVRKLSNTLLTSVFDKIAVLPGAAKVRADIAQTAQQHLDELSREPGADPLLREELAVAYRKLGDIQGGQQTPSGGDSARALESYAKSIALLEGVIAVEPGNQRARVALVKSLIMHTRGVIMTKGPQAALASTRRAAELAESASAGYKDEFERAQVRSLAYYILGDVLMPLQKPAEAMAAYEKMVAIDEEYVASYPDNTDGLKLLRNAYNNAGIAIDSRLTPQQAFERTSGYMQKSLAVTEKLLAQDPGSIEHATRLAEQRYNLADSNFNAGHYERAIELNRQAMPVLRKAAEDEGDARAQLQVGLCETSLASALVRTGKLAEPAPLFNSAERTFRKLLERDPENISLRFMLAAVEIYRGEMFSRLGSWDKARASLEPGVARMKAVNEQYPLAGGEKAVMDAGIAGLAAAQAALASR